MTATRQVRRGEAFARRRRAWSVAGTSTSPFIVMSGRPAGPVVDGITLASERAGEYATGARPDGGADGDPDGGAGSDPGSGSGSGSGSGAGSGSGCCSACRSGCDAPASCTPDEDLAAAIDRLLAVEVDDLDEAAITAELEVVERASRRLDARRCRLASAMAARRAERAQKQADAKGQDRHRARQRARREAENEMANRHRWSKSDAKRATNVGDALGDDDETQAAFDEGSLPPRHAQLLAETLKELDGDQREEARRTLLAAAAVEDAKTFGRTCRRVLATYDAAAAMRGENRRYQRRRASVSGTDDGMLAVHGQWSGVDAEVVATAIEAFRRPDPSGVHRTPGQRTADAVVELARAALRAGEAPTVHGVRPHVSVLIDYESILADAAAVEAGDVGAPVVVDAPWSGPLPFAEVRRLLADAGVSRLLVDPEGVPLEAGGEVRDVPAGLWRSLVARDGGCIAEGCEALVGWCDVMHLDRPFRLQGRLSLENGALGCRQHHRCFDLYGWVIDWDGRRPRLRPPPT